MAVKIVYKDIAPGAKEDILSVTALNYNQSLSDIDGIKKDTVVPVKYATLEKNQWRLDGTYKYLTQNNIPYVSNNVSADYPTFDGVDYYAFENRPQIVRTFNNKHKSTGVTIIFDEPDYCKKVVVTWENEDEIVVETFYPDKSEFFCEEKIDIFNKVTIDFYGMNKPNRLLKVWAIDDGVNRTYTDKDISNVTILEEMSLISEDIPINTLNFSVVRQQGPELMFQEKQPIMVFDNENIIGMYFVDSGERESKNIYDVSASDYKSILDQNIFYGGIYNGILAGKLIEEIFKEEKIELEIDDETYNTPLSGYLKIDTKRNSLMQVLFATCSVCSTARTNTFRIFKMPTGTKVVPADRIKDGGKVKTVPKPTSVKINVHQYVIGTKTTEVFKGQVLPGENLIEFANPVDVDSIYEQGCKLVFAHSNYCIVTATEEKEITIEANEYVDNITTKEKKDPNRILGKATNTKEITDATLVSNSNYQAVLDNVYNYYMMNESLECDAQILDEQVGEEITLQTSWSGTKTGRVEQLEYDIRGKKIGKVVQRING